MLDIKMFVDAGLASEETLKIKDAKISPHQFLLNLLNARSLMGWPKGVTPDDWEVTRIIAIGKKNGNRISYTTDSIFRSNKKWRATAGEVAVGVPASIAAQMLAKGEIDVKGAVPPEACIEPTPFMTELAKRNIEIYEKVKRTVR